MSRLQFLFLMATPLFDEAVPWACGSSDGTVWMSLR